MDMKAFFGVHKPYDFTVVSVTVQAGKATKVADEKDWYELESEKRAKITFDTSPQLRKREGAPGPLIRINLETGLGEVDCKETLVSASCLLESVESALSKLLGKDSSAMIRPVSPPDDEFMRFQCDDAHRFVRLLRQHREMGPILAV